MGLYSRPLILAHRCQYRGYPENSLLSLQQAIKHGCDYVDCRFTKEGRIISVHNDDLKHYGIDKMIHDMNLEEIRKVDIGMGEKIPLVEEMLQIISKSKIYVELDIKEEEVLDYEEHPNENIPELLIKYHMEKRANINLSMFAPAEYIIENPRYEKIGFRFTYNAFNFNEGLLIDLKKHDFFGLDLHAETLTLNVVKLIHDYKFEVQTYPINDPIIMNKMIEADVDVIQTDRIEILQEVLRKKGFHIR
jgi:glycerophosphoryl diester phosphodiesterase